MVDNVGLQESAGTSAAVFKAMMLKVAAALVNQIVSFNRASNRSVHTMEATPTSLLVPAQRPEWRAAATAAMN